MKITKEWIELNASENGGWTAKQLRILGIDWPPKKGWKKEIIGREITNQAAELFESLQKKESLNATRRG